MEEIQMKKHTKAIYRDMERLAEDARALVAATADMTGEEVEAVRKRLNAALHHARSILNRAEDDAIDRAHAAVKCVSENPGRSLALAFAAGAFAGGFVALGWSRPCD
jgi:ElaB/YqjD/DUF883 family membrane-anchored ribosome-binding protein